MKYKAFLFDLNGTMIDDMNYHIEAWHRILNELGANISMQRMKEECYGKNNELLERIFPGRFNENEKNSMSLEKEKDYQRQFQPYLTLLPGLNDFLHNSKKAGIKLAIGSAAIRSNIDFVLNNLNLQHLFDAVISADNVQHSKPHPETYLECDRLLGVQPANCIVFEDVPKGVESALNAGMDAYVITLLHPIEDFKNYPNVVGHSKDYLDLGLDLK